MAYIDTKKRVTLYIKTISLLTSTRRAPILETVRFSRQTESNTLCT